MGKQPRHNGVPFPRSHSWYVAKAGVPLGQPLGPRRCSVMVTHQLPHLPQEMSWAPVSFSLGASRSNVSKQKGPSAFQMAGPKAGQAPSRQGAGSGLCTQTLLPPCPRAPLRQLQLLLWSKKSLLRRAGRGRLLPAPAGCHFFRSFSRADTL